jgi:acyl-ACP thioesterase
MALEGLNNAIYLKWLAQYLSHSYMQHTIKKP